MFEKEVENTSKELAISWVNYHYDPAVRITRYGLEGAYRAGYKDGAEFGYNKANEWHKQEVDDIYDLIAEDWSIRYFICVMKDWNHVTAIGSCDEGCSGEVSVNLFFEHDDEKYHIDDIVWWKEIVLPKEIK